MLTSLLGGPVGDEDDAQLAFGQALQKRGIPGVHNLEDASALLESLQKNARQAQLKTQGTSDLLQFRGAVDTLELQGSVSIGAVSLASTLDSFLSEQHQRELDLEKLLAAADDIVSANPAAVSECPLCESAVDGSILLESIRRRREAALTLSQAAVEISRACGDLIGAVQPTLHAVKSVESKLRVVDSAGDVTKAATSCSQLLQKVIGNLKSCSELDGKLDVDALRCAAEDLKNLREKVERVVRKRFRR
jgi:hypothetical protein